MEFLFFISITSTIISFAFLCAPEDPPIVRGPIIGHNIITGPIYAWTQYPSFGRGDRSFDWQKLGIGLLLLVISASVWMWEHYVPGGFLRFASSIAYYICTPIGCVLILNTWISRFIFEDPQMNKRNHRKLNTFLLVLFFFGCIAGAIFTGREIWM